MTDPGSFASTPDQEWVQAQLGALPQPAMPADVTERITAALRAEQANEQTAAEEPTPIHRRRGLLTGLAVAASVALALMLVSVAPWQSPSDSYERVVALSTVQPVSTNTDYTAENIQQAVSAHLNNLTSRAATVPVASESRRRGSFAANDDVMASCLDGLGAVASQVQLVDLADYQGQPSGVVVVSDGDGNLVVVVAPRCGRDDPAVRYRVSTDTSP